MILSNADKARRVELLILDIDGVLTDGGLQFDNQGEEYKTFNSLDGHGIRMLLDSDIEVAVITGRQSGIVKHRMGDLGVKHLFQGFRDKQIAFTQLLTDTGIEPANIAYIGDDLPDLPVMTRVGFAVAVQNAHAFVKQHCDWVTTASGGKGAVREVSDFILQAKNLLHAKHAAYLE
ncbi:MAG: 3-deoxy-D-manno-octulosonate 8-phosphate phosphatase (KDO 8-P phosphatase) [Planctomycetota bacterium]